MSRTIRMASPTISLRDRLAVDRVLRSGQLAQGKEVAAFEREFGEFIGAEQVVAVNSGTSGLHLSLLALGVGHGDEVIVPSFTFAATANAVALTGAKPVFVDIEPDYFCLDVTDVVAKITSKTKAIIPVHLYGQPSDMEQIVEIARKHELKIVEDAAQAHGASQNGKMMGTWGDTGVFSLYPTKNMTSGEGGLITVADSTVARQLRLLRNQGMEKRYENEVVGLNNRMTEISAALGRSQLKSLPKWNQRRQRNAATFFDGINGPLLPKVRPNSLHVFHQFTLRVPPEIRQEFVRRLSEQGIATDVYYPVPVHRLPTYGQSDSIPVTDLIVKECLSIPVHPNLSSRQVRSIVNCINKVFKGLND